MNKTIIFFDTSDSNNPGWAWRTRLADGSEESGSIDSEGATQYLRDTENGASCSVSDREALVAELKSAGVDPWTAIYVDTNGAEIGEMMLA